MTRGAAQCPPEHVRCAGHGSRISLQILSPGEEGEPTPDAAALLANCLGREVVVGDRPLQALGVSRDSRQCGGQMGLAGRFELGEQVQEGSPQAREMYRCGPCTGGGVCCAQVEAAQKLHGLSRPRRKGGSRDPVSG